MSEPKTMTVQEMLQAAATAKEAGVPVNWEAIAMSLWQLVVEANQELQTLRAEPEDDE